MKRLGLFVVVLVAVLVAFLAGYLVSRMAKPDLPYKAPEYALDGSVSVPAFKLPPSPYMSEAAVDRLKVRAVAPSSRPDVNRDIEESRATIDKLLSSVVEKALEAYPVDIEESAIAGIPVRIFTPRDKPADPDRVLINLHGGAFSVCWGACSILESAPLASLGDYRVVSVNYRMAPEAKHPAGVEDTVAVYRELRKDYAAGSIGIYGCSAGGMLTAQSTARIALEGLAVPGAIGIFGAGGVRFDSGDSAIVSAYIDGSFPPPVREGENREDLTRGYFSVIDPNDQSLSPALHPELLTKFPPVMLTTGTRAADLSPAVYTNSQLINAGVDTRLIVAEGMGHCFQYFADLPEAGEVNRAAAAFFRENLE